MSAENDGKAAKPASTHQPAPRTMVGVPVLTPDASDLDPTHEPPPKTSAAPSAAMTPRPPSVAGALPKPAAYAPLKTPPLGGDAFPGLAPESRNRAIPPEQGTRHGVAPQTPMAVKGRATLLLDSSVPPSTQADSTREGPPIIVPTSGQTSPKAVTQPPPWSDDAVRVAPSIPKASSTPRAGEMVPPEELSASHLLPADSSWDDLTVDESRKEVELTTGSIILDEPTDARIPKPSRPPPPRSVAPRSLPPTRSVPPPLPPLASRSAHPPPKPKSLPPPPVRGAPSVSATPPQPKIEYVAPPPPEVVAPQAPPTPPAAVPDAHPAPPAAEAPLARTMSSQGMPLPPPPAPVALKQRTLAETLVPVREKLAAALVGLRGLAKKVQEKLPPGSALATGGHRPKWFYPAVIAGGLLVGISLMALVVNLFAHGNSKDEGKTAPSAPSTSAAPMPSAPAPVASPTPAPASSPEPAPSPSPLAACKVAGEPRDIASSAVLAAAVEAVRLGDDIAFGFGADDHEGVAVRVDAASLHAKGTAKAKSADAVRRVTPLLRNGALSVAIDADKKGDRIQGRRTVLLSTPAQLGGADGSLVWARMGGGPGGNLWALPGVGAVEALRASFEDSDRTAAIAFRRNGAVWLGAASSDGALTPKGDLAQMSGLGPVVGSPAVAISGDHVLAAWADRASADEPWRLRWAHFSVGEVPAGASSFETPAGGKGQNAMSPSIAPLPGGRFLLVWTEGPTSGHDVRALTVASDGTALGAPLSISTPGGNAGQGQAAVTASGQGAVAFLSAAGERFEVAATPIDCGP